MSVTISQRDLETIKNRKQQLLRDQERWRKKWKSTAEQFAPDRGRYLTGDDPNADEHKNPFKQLIDTTGIDSVRTAAAGMNSGLTPRARPWFNLQAADPFLRRDLIVRSYLDERAQVQAAYFQRTNTHNVLFQSYLELLVFGSAAFAIDSNTDDGSAWRCVPFTAGEYALDINAAGQVDTFYRRARWTVKQIADRWARNDDGSHDPSKLPLQIARAYKEGKLNQRFYLDHLIEPNDDRMDLKDAQGRPFRSVYCLEKMDTDSVLSVSGFSQFPVVAPRWDVPGMGVYGTGPCEAALGASHCLQQMAKDGLKALAKMVDPPTQGQTREVRMNPGQHNTLMAGTDSIKPIHEVRPELAALLAIQQDKRQQVRTLLFADLFLMLNQMDRAPQMTAYEVAERNAERLQILGPVLDRLETEMLEPVIRITGAILDDKGLSPPIPEELAGREVVVEYTSVLAQAQELLGVRAIREWAGWADQVAARRPEVDDKIDWDEVVDDLGQRYSVPARFLRRPEEVEARRMARQQAMEQQEMVDQGLQSARTAKTLAEAPLGDGSSVLDAMLGAGAAP